MNESIALFNPIGEKIYRIREQFVMLDRDLAGLYGVETKNLNRQVKRNPDRFAGKDFMFQLTIVEYERLRCQFGTANGIAKARVPAYVFTELGIAMLSSILNSPMAIRVNRQIMRYFAHMRKLELSDNDFKKFAEAKLKLLDYEMKNNSKRIDLQNEVIKDIIDQIRRMVSPFKEKKQIGFKLGD